MQLSFPADEELKKLGRQRPEILRNAVIEVGFCISMLTSIVMAEYFISGFNLLLPTLTQALNIPPESQTWPASVFSLVTAAFLLPFGRFCDIYGGRPIFILGLSFYFVWSLIAGFSQNYVMLICCRALQGLGTAAFLPSGMMLLGSIYRPGPRKNLVFCLYGAAAPLGFFSGILFSGIAGQYLDWAWYFWIGSIVLLCLVMLSYLTVPATGLPSGSDRPQMDWWGSITIVPALLLLVFAITNSSQAPDGWRSPYILTTFILGIVALGAFFCVEYWVAESPLLPSSLFATKSMIAVSIALLFLYGSWGIFLMYANLYIENILGASPLKTMVWSIPMAAGGLVLATCGGFVLHRLSGTVLIIISVMGYLASSLLFALIPVNPNYWAWIFPAMLGCTIGGDISFSVTNVFITSTVPKAQQGIAGAFINCLLFLGISLFLGVADYTASRTRHLGLETSYKAAFWLEAGCVGAALIVILIRVRIGKAKHDLTVDEKIQLRNELMERQDATGLDGAASTGSLAMKTS